VRCGLHAGRVLLACLPSLAVLSGAFKTGHGKLKIAVPASHASCPPPSQTGPDEVITLTGPRGRITRLHWVDNNRHLLSSSEDGMVRVQLCGWRWSVLDCTCSCRAAHKAYCTLHTSCRACCFVRSPKHALTHKPTSSLLHSLPPARRCGGGTLRRARCCRRRSCTTSRSATCRCVWHSGGAVWRGSDRTSGVAGKWDGSAG